MFELQSSCRRRCKTDTNDNKSLKTFFALAFYIVTNDLQPAVSLMAYCLHCLFILQCRVVLFYLKNVQKYYDVIFFTRVVEFSLYIFSCYICATAMDINPYIPDLLVLCFCDKTSVQFCVILFRVLL